MANQEVLTLEAPPADAVLAIIAQASRDPQVDVSKLQILLEMRERVMAKEAEGAFYRAMKSAQAEMVPIVRNAINAQTQSRYATLEQVDIAIRPIYTRHGFALTSDSPLSEGHGVTVSTTAMHEAGHARTYRLNGSLDTTGPQGKANKTEMHGLGSSISYLRRYLKLMIFDLVLTNEDNDGNGREKLLDEQQANSILDMLNACDIKPNTPSMKSFLGLADATRLATIRAVSYDRLMQALQSKLDKKNGVR